MPLDISGSMFVVYVQAQAEMQGRTVVTDNGVVSG